MLSLKRSIDKDRLGSGVEQMQAAASALQSLCVGKRLIMKLVFYGRRLLRDDPLRRWAKVGAPAAGGRVDAGLCCRPALLLCFLCKLLPLRNSHLLWNFGHLTKCRAVNEAAASCDCLAYVFLAATFSLLLVLKTWLREGLPRELPCVSSDSQMRSLGHDSCRAPGCSRPPWLCSTALASGRHSCGVRCPGLSLASNQRHLTLGCCVYALGLCLLYVP